MEVGLHDAEYDTLKNKNFPNLALMKISTFHKNNGDHVEWWIPLKKYDRVYSSKIFDYTSINPYLPKNTIKGGTGYDIITKLPEKIDNCYPDYSIYKNCDYAIGYITRGCIRNCRWCVVPAKEGYIQSYNSWKEIKREDTKKIVLMDNNILASEHGINQLEDLTESGYSVDLNQGMDARLVNDKVAKIISKLKWIKYIRFSCDQMSQVEHIKNAAKILEKYGVKSYRLFIYFLVTKNIEEAITRIEELKKIKGITIYAQAEKNYCLGIMPNKIQREFAQRYVYSGKYRTESWDKYCERKNFKEEGN